MKRLFRAEGGMPMLALLTLWSAVVLMLMSMDSPLHHIYMRVDSAWFFMGGKAMMNGLRPYVDFADSKGPLLWLVYGIGYLLSPRNYVGVYFLSCLCYGGILYHNYKTARLLLGDERRALLVALLMPWFYFLYWFHNEIRAEDFSTLFVSASMYYLFLLLYGEKGHGAEQPCTVSRCGLVMGVSFMALFLIKWNIALMQGSMMAVALYHYFREDRRSMVPFVAWSAAGMCAVTLPFVVYLLVIGSFAAFIQEYFINTLLTINTPHGMPETYGGDLEKAWGEPARQFMLLAIAAGGWLLGRLLPRYRYVPLLVGLFFYGIATKHGFYYYFTICSIFYIYILVYLVSLAVRPPGGRHLAVAAVAVIAWGIFDNCREGSQLKAVAKWSGGEDREEYVKALRIAETMSDYEKPTVLNLFYYELGFEVPCKGLPAGKYFAWQNGMTDEMAAEHVALLKSGKADFIVVGDIDECIKNGYSEEVIESYGYKWVLYTDYKSEGKYRKNVAVYKNKRLE